MKTKHNTVYEIRHTIDTSAQYTWTLAFINKEKTQC